MSDFRWTGRTVDTALAMRKLGKTWDGDVPSKIGRDELVDAGYAKRDGNGYQALTSSGEIALSLYLSRRHCEEP